MNMLIVAGLMAIGLIAIVGVIFLAMGEEKTTKIEKEPAIQQQLPAIREASQAAIISDQFHELSTQLRILHEQAQEIEHRLGLLVQAADHIESSHDVSIEEMEDYILPEPITNAASH